VTITATCVRNAGKIERRTERSVARTAPSAVRIGGRIASNGVMIGAMPPRLHDVTTAPNAGIGALKQALSNVVPPRSIAIVDGVKCGRIDTRTNAQRKGGTAIAHNSGEGTRFASTARNGALSTARIACSGT
jgi:hypothetical protein